MPFDKAQDVQQSVSLRLEMGCRNTWTGHDKFWLCFSSSLHDSCRQFQKTVGDSRVRMVNVWDARWVGCALYCITVAGVAEVVEMPAELVLITLPFSETGADHPEHSEDCRSSAGAFHLQGRDGHPFYVAATSSFFPEGGENRGSPPGPACGQDPRFHGSAAIPSTVSSSRLCSLAGFRPTCEREHGRIILVHNQYAMDHAMAIILLYPYPDRAIGV